MGRIWPLWYLIRHSGFHTMDRAWEMEDKDLTPERQRSVCLSRGPER